MRYIIFQYGLEPVLLQRMDIDRIESHASRMLPGHQHLVEFQNLEATNSKQEFFFTFYIFFIDVGGWKYWE